MKGTSLKAMRLPLALNKVRVRGLSLGVRNSPRSGQSLVEAIVAIGITVLVITGLVVLAVGAVRSATLSRNRSVAVQYAQEGVEALRSVRDRDFTVLPDSGTTKLFWDGSQWNVLTGSETIGLYSRSFTSS